MTEARIAKARSFLTEILGECAEIEDHLIWMTADYREAADGSVLQGAKVDMVNDEFTITAAIGQEPREHIWEVIGYAVWYGFGVTCHTWACEDSSIPKRT